MPFFTPRRQFADAAYTTFGWFFSCGLTRIPLLPGSLASGLCTRLRYFQHRLPYIPACLPAIYRFIPTYLPYAFSTFKFWTVGFIFHHLLLPTFPATIPAVHFLWLQMAKAHLPLYTCGSVHSRRLGVALHSPTVYVLLLPTIHTVQLLRFWLTP